MNEAFRVKHSISEMDGSEGKKSVSHPSTNLAQRCLTSVIERGRAIGENRFRRETETERVRAPSNRFLGTEVFKSVKERKSASVYAVA